MSMNPPNQQSSNAISIIAIVLGAVALLVLPIVLGPIAIVLAIIAKSKGEKLAKIALIVGIAGTALGIIIGAVIGASMFA